MTSFFPGIGLSTVVLALACGTAPEPRAPAAPAPTTERGEDEQCEVLFLRADKNGDGSVSEAEFSTIPHPEQDDPHTTFLLRDQSQDGALSIPEFCAAARVALIL